MRSVRKREFKQLFKRLPLPIRQMARDKFRLFYANPRHPSFRVKRIRITETWEHPHWEYSLSTDYRAVCYLDRDTYVWVFIGSHQEFDRLY